MWVLPFFVKNALTTTLNSPMSSAAHINPDIASVNTTEVLLLKKLLRAYPKVVYYLSRSLQTSKG